MSVTEAFAMAKKKPVEPETKSERVIFLASPSWVERMNENAESLGLSLAAFIRLSCEEKQRRMDGKPEA